MEENQSVTIWKLVKNTGIWVVVRTYDFFYARDVYGFTDIGKYKHIKGEVFAIFNHGTNPNK